MQIASPPTRTSDSPAGVPQPRDLRAPAESEQPLRLMLVDDHPILRAGLRALLSAQSDFDVVAEAASGEEAIRLARTVRPDLILLDFSMPGLNGAEVVRGLKQEFSGVRVLAVSVHDELPIVHGVLDAGADGYLLKRSACDELVPAVRQVAAGMRYLDPALPRQTSLPSVRRNAPPGLRLQLLSDRESEVVRLLAQGQSRKEVAQQLNLSPRTLETYRARAMEKLKLKTRADLIGYAMKRGWLATD